MIISYTNNTVDYSTFYWYMEPPYCELNIDKNTSKSIPFEEEILTTYEEDKDHVRMECGLLATVCLHKPLPHLKNDNVNINLGIESIDNNNNINWHNYNNLLTSWYYSAVVDDFSEFKIYYSGFNKNNINYNSSRMQDMNIYSDYGANYGFNDGKFYRDFVVLFDISNYYFQKYIKMKAGYILVHLSISI